MQGGLRAAAAVSRSTLANKSRRLAGGRTGKLSSLTASKSRKLAATNKWRAAGASYTAVQYRDQRLMSVKKRCQPRKNPAMQKVHKHYLVRETTDVDSVYYIGLFPSYSDAQAFIDDYANSDAAEAEWLREIVDVAHLIPGFTPVELVREDIHAFQSDTVEK
jgi:hypothetical protein